MPQAASVRENRQLGVISQDMGDAWSKYVFLHFYNFDFVECRFFQVVKPYLKMIKKKIKKVKYLSCRCVHVVCLFVCGGGGG